MEPEARGLYTGRMSMSPASLRLLVLPGLFASFALAGCKDNLEMVTAAWDSVSDGSTAGGTTEATGGSATTGEPTTSGVPTTSDTTPGTTTSTSNTTNTTNTSTTSNTTNTSMGTSTTGEMTTGSGTWDPSETTGPPAMCNGPEDCTGEGMGDFGPATMPFFRGDVCVSDTLRPKDMLAISFNPCIHPCLAPGVYGWRYIVRCVNGCEIGFMLYYDEAVGKNCPSDVFHKFDPALCVYPGPHNALTQPLMGLGGPDDKVLVPFLTNEDTAAMIKETPTQVWARIDGHTQAAERYFPLNVDANNPAPPTTCKQGQAGCTCKKIGF